MNPPYRRLVLGVILALGMLGAIPGVAFAAQPACGDSLTANTTLTADLDCSSYAGNALTLDKNGIELNLNGHTIWGPTGDDGYYGVDTGGRSRVVVRNGTIANFQGGLYQYASSSSAFRGLTITGEGADADDVGVYSTFGAGDVFKNLTITGVYYGMSMYGGAEHMILGSDITADYYGVYSTYESLTEFHNNHVHSDQYGFYDDYSGGLVFVANTANGGGSTGFYLDCDDFGRVTLINNVANNNDGDGFYMYYCYDENTTLERGSWVSSNVANDNGDDGFDTEGNNNSTFQYNVAKRNNSDGFEDYYGIGSQWLSNTAKNNDGDGFYFDYPADYVIKFNVARGNDDDGFEMADNYSTSYYNVRTFSWNTATYNDDYGVTAGYGVPGKGNIANHNTTDNCYNVVCN